MPHYTPLQIAQHRHDNETPFEADDVPRCAACKIGEMLLLRDGRERCENCDRIFMNNEETELLVESGAEASMHARLIEAAAKWLTRNGCSIVVTDMSHGGRETPDAIGWQNIYSTLIECKASVADFLADAHKFFRRYPEQGMGNYRYYCTPVGLLADRELPPGWGLLEWDGKRMMKVKPAAQQRHHDGARQEISVLASAMRRLAGPRPQGISCRAYTIESKNRATLGIATDEPAQP